MGGVTTHGPVLIRPPDLSVYYPYGARVKGVVGETRVRLTIAETGRVVGVEVLRSVPARVFEAAARRACQRLRFRPATRNGKPTRAVKELALVWRLE